MSASLERRAGGALAWNVAQLAGVQGVQIVRVVVLARLLSPDDFGLLAIALVALEFVLSLTDLGMVPALVQRREVERRHYDAAWTVTLARSLAITAVVFAAAPYVAAHVFDEPRATAVIRLVALRPTIQALGSIRLAARMRELDFRGPAALKIADSVVNAAVSIALASTLGIWALVVGVLSGAAVHAIASYAVAPYRPRIAFDSEASSDLIRFGRWILATTSVAVLGRAALQSVVARQLGTVELGIYYLSAKLAFFPGDVVGDVAGSVAFPFVSRVAERVRSAGRAFRAILTGVALPVVPVLAILHAASPELAGRVLGDDWAGTPPVVRVLVIAALLGLFGDAVVPVFKGLGAPSRVALLELVQSTALVVSVWFLAGTYGLVGAAWSWVIAIGCSQLFAVALLSRSVERPFAGVAGPIAAIAVASAAAWWVTRAVLDASGGALGFVAAVVGGLAAVVAVFAVAERIGVLGIARALATMFPGLARYVGRTSEEGADVGPS